MSWEKELQFFSRNDRWARGTEWYQSRFESKPGLVGESSPQYTWSPWVSEAPSRMYSVIPDAKLIYVVRDPIDRMVSQYVDWVDLFWERREFAEAMAGLDKRPNRYVEPGLYYYQLEQYLHFYPPQQIRVVVLEVLSGSIRTQMKQLFAFLGVDDNFVSDEWDLRSNPHSIKRRPNQFFRFVINDRMRDELLEPKILPMPVIQILKKIIVRTGTEIEWPAIDAALEARLMDIYRSDVERLREFSGLGLEDWRAY